MHWASLCSLPSFLSETNMTSSTESLYFLVLQVLVHRGGTVCCGPWLLGRSTITEWNIHNNNTFCEQTLTDAFHVTIMMSVSSTLLDWVLDNIHLSLNHFSGSCSSQGRASPFQTSGICGREASPQPDAASIRHTTMIEVVFDLQCFWSSHQRTFLKLTLDYGDLQSRRCFCIIIRFGLFSDLFSELTGGFLYLHGVTVRHWWILGIAVPV